MNYAIYTLIPLIFKQTFGSEIKCFSDIGENYLPKMNHISGLMFALTLVAIEIAGTNAGNSQII